MQCYNNFHYPASALMSKHLQQILSTIECDVLRPGRHGNNTERYLLGDEIVPAEIGNK